MSKDVSLVISEEARVEQACVGHVGEEGMWEVALDGPVVGASVRSVLSCFMKHHNFRFGRYG